MNHLSNIYRHEHDAQLHFKNFLNPVLFAKIDMVQVNVESNINPFDKGKYITAPSAAVLLVNTHSVILISAPLS